MENFFNAWSNSQIDSKLWLCRELEKINKKSPKNFKIWVLGSWIGILPFLMFTREQMNIDYIWGFDLDNDSVSKSLKINENYVIKGKYNAFVKDVGELDYRILPDIVINSSSEHMDMKWWKNVPIGTMVAIQNNDYIRNDHINNVFSLEDMDEKYPTSTLYEGEMFFKYPDLEFTRFMIIGNKHES